MRIHARSLRRLQGRKRFTLTLACLQAEMPIECELVWQRKLGFRSHELGVEFLNVSDEQRAFLTQLVQLAGVRRTMPITDAA